MRPGRMRNGFCWSAARLGVWTVVGRAGGLSPGTLGAPGSRRRHGRLPRAARRIPRDAALQRPAGSPSDPS
uniref:Uncharacterized protein n=1 Tax=Setaria viridis TaxID=4556 RepID=A0A4U6TNI2_SETVI|nr:hypothetical protein SEVIR_7G009401v2 [Setaria viridis]